jgi:hypothetical protein
VKPSTDCSGRSGLSSRVAVTVSSGGPNKKAGETAGFFELIGSDRDQYFATTGPPQR